MILWLCSYPNSQLLPANVWSCLLVAPVQSGACFSTGLVVVHRKPRAISTGESMMNHWIEWSIPFWNKGASPCLCLLHQVCYLIESISSTFWSVKSDIRFVLSTWSLFYLTCMWLWLHLPRNPKNMWDVGFGSQKIPNSILCFWDMLSLVDHIPLYVASPRLGQRSHSQVAGGCRGLFRVPRHDFWMGVFHQKK